MTTLTGSTTFSVGDSDTEITTTPLLILPLAGIGEGTGRLIHPDIGTYDYPYAPDEWLNFDSDIIIPPVWGGAKTLDGAANMLFAGHIRDVEVEEHWTSEIGGPLTFMRVLLAMWQNPPDPDDGYVQWYPSYANEFGYNVLILSVKLGGQDVTMNYVTRQTDSVGDRWVEGTIVIRMRIIEKL